MANLVAIWTMASSQTQSSRKNQHDVRGNIDGDRIVDLQVTDDERSNYYCVVGAWAAFEASVDVRAGSCIEINQRFPIRRLKQGWSIFPKGWNGLAMVAARVNDLTFHVKRWTSSPRSCLSISIEYLTYRLPKAPPTGTSYLVLSAS